MIALRLPGYPEKDLDGELSLDGGPEGRWDLDVWERIWPFRRRVVRLCREGLSLEEAIDVLFEHSGGDADHLLKALGLNALAREGWRRHLARHPPTGSERS